MTHEHDFNRPSQRKRGHSVSAAAYEVGISERLMWKRIKSGDVRVVRLGRRTIVTDDEVQRLLTEGF